VQSVGMITRLFGEVSDGLQVHVKARQDIL
jgi:hypothetical protein